MSTNTRNHPGLRIRDFARLPSSSPHEDRTIKEEPNQEPVWDENSNPLENIPSLGLELLKVKNYLLGRALFFENARTALPHTYLL